MTTNIMHTLIHAHLSVAFSLHIPQGQNYWFSLSLGLVRKADLEDQYDSIGSTTQLL